MRQIVEDCWDNPPIWFKSKSDPDADIDENDEEDEDESTNSNSASASAGNLEEEIQTGTPDHEDIDLLVTSGLINESDHKKITEKLKKVKTSEFPLYQIANNENSSNTCEVVHAKSKSFTYRGKNIT